MLERTKDLIVFGSMVGLLIFTFIISNIMMSRRFAKLEKVIIKNEQIVKKEIKKLDNRKQIAELKKAVAIQDNMLKEKEDQIIEYKEYLDTLYIEHLLREGGE